MFDKNVHKESIAKEVLQAFVRVLDMMDTSLNMASFYFAIRNWPRSIPFWVGTV